MQDSRTPFIRNLLKFSKTSPCFGMRLDMVQNRWFFESKPNLITLFEFCKNTHIKLINIGSIFPRVHDKLISSFAIDEQTLSPILLPEDFQRTDDIIEDFLTYFTQISSTAARTDFAHFCNDQKYWLESYSFYRALSEHIKNYNFSKWPDLIRLHDRKALSIVKRQLSKSILRYKALQYFAHLQLETIKSMARSYDIYIMGECNVACEEHSTETWSHPFAFFLDDYSHATVYQGLPPSESCPNGFKTTKVPYRVGYLKESRYELLDDMFRRWQGLFDAVLLMSGHTLFQYWEISQEETVPQNGHWTNVNNQQLFEHFDINLHHFPYFFDFNEPLFPDNEHLSSKHRFIISVVDGEPTQHATETYHFERKIFMIASKGNDRKLPLRKLSILENANHAKSCLKNYAQQDYVFCLLHIHEIAALANIAPESLYSNLPQIEKTFQQYQNEVRNKPTLKAYNDHPASPFVPSKEPQPKIVTTSPSTSSRWLRKLTQFFKKP